VSPGPPAHDSIAGDDLHWSAGVTDDQMREDIISEWDLSHELRSLKYGHTDFAAEAPAADLKKEAQRSAPYPAHGDLEVFDYPGGFDDIAMKAGSTGAKTQEAERLAKLRVDAFESEHVIARGVTPSRDVATGSTFNLKGHDDNDGFLVALTEYHMEYGGYEANYGEGRLQFSCHFEAVPKKTRFQPHARIARPVIAGPQTATVVGPSGDEIHTDEHGRVKLKFHWDRVGKNDEKASCWVRVSFPWASKQFGMVALPRIGDEVVVEFLEGNPDRPLVTGAVYNGTNKPPYELPAQSTVSGIKSQSSKGGSLSNFNELRFDDKKGSEYVWFQAEKDFHRNVKMDATDAIGQHNQVDIKKNNTVSIGENFALSVGKNTSIDIGGDAGTKVAGDVNLEAGAALNVKTGAAVAVKGGAALTATAEAAMDVNAGADLNLTAATAMAIKAGTGITIDGGVKISIKAGAGWITIGPDGVSMGGPLVKINSGGSGTSAKPAKKASPTAPKAPAKVQEKKDPLAK
jgi:type VI secretion system secreted protein VgrG